MHAPSSSKQCSCCYRRANGAIASVACSLDVVLFRSVVSRCGREGQARNCSFCGLAGGGAAGGGTARRTAYGFLFFAIVVSFENQRRPNESGTHH